MSKSVSNDALWEKLSEIEEKLESLSTVCKPESIKMEAESATSAKDEIKALIEVHANILGTHSQSHFDANKQNIITLGENIRKVLNIVSHIRKQQKETIEQASFNNIELPNDEKSYFNLKFFKARKSAVIMSILGLLVFILTIFCMKQQNDYSLLNHLYYRQNVETKKTQMEMDSLRNVEKLNIKK